MVETEHTGKHSPRGYEEYRLMRSYAILSTLGVERLNEFVDVDREGGFCGVVTRLGLGNLAKTFGKVQALTNAENNTGGKDSEQEWFLFIAKVQIERVNTT
jgi:hypothetical protein